MDILSWIHRPDGREELEVVPDAWPECFLQLIFVLPEACGFLLFPCFVAKT